MQESNGRESSNETEDSDATSKETVSDLEESEKDDGAGSAPNEPGPSPDGAFDEGDESDAAGPV